MALPLPVKKMGKLFCLIVKILVKLKAYGKIDKKIL